jgi:hypothetical protein
MTRKVKSLRTHFENMADLDKIADFVTWAKYISDKQLEQIPDKAFTVGLLPINGKKYMVADPEAKARFII